jgi:hypothetical protein
VKAKQAATVRNGAEGVANSLNNAINTERSGVSSSRMCEAKIENIIQPSERCILTIENYRKVIVKRCGIKALRKTSVRQL